MSAQALIDKFASAGVRLVWKDDQLKALGKPDIVQPLLPAIRQHKAELEQHLRPPVSAEVIAQAAEVIQRAKQPHHHLDAPWRTAAAGYYQHHVNCSQCQGAGQGRGRRCAVGLELWMVYEAALERATP